jgi:hypothetical protein
MRNEVYKKYRLQILCVAGAVLVNLFIVGVFYLNKGQFKDKGTSWNLESKVLGVEATPTESVTPSPSLTATPTSVLMPKTKEQPYEGYLYTNKRYGFTMVIPKDWTVTESLKVGCGTPDDPNAICQTIVVDGNQARLKTYLTVTNELDRGIIGAVRPDKSYYRYGSTKIWSSERGIYRTEFGLENQTRFMCYGMDYKVCDRLDYKDWDFSVYAYSGFTSNYIAEGLNIDEMFIIDLVIDSITPLK